MVPVETWLRALIAQTGDRYVYGAETSPLDPDPDIFDCSELIEWASARAGIQPRVPDGSWAQWAHVARHGQVLAVSDAVYRRGAVLHRDGHIAVSLGDGRTIEARGRKYGVGSWSAPGRFQRAGLLPGIDYRHDPPGPRSVGGRPMVLGDGHVVMGPAVRFYEAMLNIASGNPPRNKIDGVWGTPLTRYTHDFQKVMGLPKSEQDGLAGPKTCGLVGYVVRLKLDGLVH